MEAWGTPLDSDRFAKGGGTAENVACSPERPHWKANRLQMPRNKKRIVARNAFSGGQSGIEFAPSSAGPEAGARSSSSESAKDGAEDASSRSGGADETQPVASTSGRGDIEPGAGFISGRRGSRRGEASRQWRHGVEDRKQARHAVEPERGDSLDAKELRRAGADDFVGGGATEENGRQKAALGAQSETNDRGRSGLHLGANSGNGVESVSLEAPRGGRNEAQLHTDERPNVVRDERRTRRAGATERGGSATFAPGLQSLLLTLKSTKEPPPPPSAFASFPGQKDDPRAWRRPLPPADSAETVLPRKNRRRSKARQLEPHLVTQVVEELKREPQWGNIAGILDKWEGRTSLRNYELLMKELCWQGDYLRSVKAFAWMKEQRNWYRPR